MITFLITSAIALFSLKESYRLVEILNLDLFNNFIFMVSLAVSMVIKRIKIREKNKSENNFLVGAILTSRNFSFLTNNILLSLVGLEITIYPIAKLFMTQSKDKDKTSSLIFIFNINIAGSLIFLYTVSKLICYTIIPSLIFGLWHCEEFVISLFFCAILLTKVPILFTQFWLSKAHVAASGMCSVILAALILKLGSYIMLKFWFAFYLVWNPFLNTFFCTNILAVVIIIILMTRFVDLKLIIAYSSIMHIAMRIPFIIRWRRIGVLASIMNIVSHAFISSILFFIVTSSYETTLRRSIDCNKRAGRTNKTVTIILFYLAVVNIGFPPLVRFYTEIIYLHNLIKISTLASASLSLSILAIIIFNMMLILSLNFGKKTIKVKKDLNLKVIQNFTTIATIILIVPFLASYFYSLRRT